MSYGLIDALRNADEDGREILVVDSLGPVLAHAYEWEQGDDLSLWLDDGAERGVYLDVDLVPLDSDLVLCDVASRPVRILLDSTTTIRLARLLLRLPGPTS